MPYPLMLLCKLALRAQTCTRIRWQYALYNEIYAIVLLVPEYNQFSRFVIS